MTTITTQQISAIVHQNLPHVNPLSAEQMDQLVTLAVAKCPLTALEIGCGPGTFSLALAHHAGISVTALDTNPYFLARAREAASKMTLTGSISFEQKAANDYLGEPVDLVICIGSSQAFGTPREAVIKTARLLRPGGSLVFGDLVWSSIPPNDFLDFLGVPESNYWMVESSTAVFDSAGFVVTAETHASRDSWHQYERAVLQGRLDLAKSLPSEQGASLRFRAESWFQEYELYGQYCLGFAVYIATHMEINSQSH